MDYSGTARKSRGVSKESSRVSEENSQVLGETGGLFQQKPRAVRKQRAKDANFRAPRRRTTRCKAIRPRAIACATSGGCGRRPRLRASALPLRGDDSAKPPPTTRRTWWERAVALRNARNGGEKSRRPRAGVRIFRERPRRCYFGEDAAGRTATNRKSESVNTCG